MFLLVLPALAAPGARGFYPRWDPATPSAAWSVSEPTSTFKETVTLRACDVSQSPEPGVSHLIGDADTFLFDDAGYWRELSKSTSYWSTTAPCDDTMSDRRCMEAVFAHTDKEVFCFEPGTYEQGCEDSFGAERNLEECGYSVVSDPDEDYGWSAPIVINRSREAGEELQIRNLYLEEDEHPTDHPSERVDLKMPITFQDVSNNSGVTGPSWTVHGLSLREQAHVDRAPLSVLNSCDAAAWDHSSWFNLAKYDNPDSTVNATAHYEGSGNFWGDGHSWKESRGRTYSGFYSSTILLQCTSEVLLSHLELVDNDHLNNVYIKGQSHQNAVQSTVMGYTDAFVFAHREELTDWLTMHSADFPITEEDMLSVGAPDGDGTWSDPDDLNALYLLRLWRGDYPEHEFFQDNLCVMFQGHQGDVTGVELHTAEDNRIIENEFINCNDGIHLQHGSSWKDTNGDGAWDDGDNAWWSVYPGTIIENNDLYVTRALYTDCNGVPFYDEDGDLLDPTTDENLLCSISENAMDFKAGGWLPLKDVSVKANWPYFDASEVQTTASEQVRVLRNRMWGYRQTDPTLSIKVGSLDGSTLYVPNSNRQDSGVAIVSHFNANGIVLASNVIADSVSGIALTNSTDVWDSGVVLSGSLHYFLAVNNLIADAAWLADPTARWSISLPSNSDALWWTAGEAQAWYQNTAMRQNGPSTFSCNTVVRSYTWLTSNSLADEATLRGNVVLDGGIVFSEYEDIVSALDDNEYLSTALTPWGGAGDLNSPTQILSEEGWPVLTAEPREFMIDSRSVPTLTVTYTPTHSGPTLRQLSFPETRWLAEPGPVVLGMPFSNNTEMVCDPDDWNVASGDDIFTSWLP